MLPVVAWPMFGFPGSAFAEGRVGAATVEYSCAPGTA
jgi:hypothetical protein